MSWKKEVKEISLRKKLALQQGGKEAIEIQHAKGRLTPVSYTHLTLPTTLTV